MNFRCKLRHRSSIPWPRFPIIVQTSAIWLRFPLIFAFLCKISAIFLLPVCLTYWPRKYTTCTTPTAIIPTKCEVDMTIYCRVRVFCLVIRYVTLWPWPLIFWPWTVVTHGASRVQPCHQVWRPYAHSILSHAVILLDSIDIAFFGYCACAVSRDLCVGVNFTRIFGIHNPDLFIHYMVALRWK